MEDKEHHDELKGPIRSLSSEITQRYVQELIREAIKQAMKSKTRGLKEKQILKLEKQIKKKSDNEKLEQFKKPAEEISRSIREGSIEGNKALGQMSNILEKSIKPPLPLILKVLLILIFAGTPLLLFFIFMPSLSVAPENLDLAEGVSESAQLEISNTGGGVLLWTASSDQPWISLSPKRGANEGNVIVLVDADDLEEGTYEGIVTIDSLAGTEQCPIRLVVGSQPPVLAVDPHSIDFELEKGESGEEELRISNDGGGVLEWEASASEPWITLSPENGINSGTVTVTVDTADLSPEEEYERTITIESNGENEECIIYLKVLPEGKGKEKPVLAVDPDPLSFNFNLAEGEWDSEEFYISNEGGDELEWNIVPDTDWPSWIYVDPISGRNSETITIEVDAADLTSGNYNTTFRVESNEEYKEGVVSLKVSGEDEGPDLVVTSLEIVGDATRVVEGDSAYIAVPISVVVSNQGDQAADIFKVSTEYTSSSGTYAVAFRIPGESNTWYPYTDEPLDPGEEFTFEGEVLFSDSLSDETVYLKAIADSCSGDEFEPAYCRVEESNEENNESPEVEVYLPTPELKGPDLVVTSLEVTGSPKSDEYALPIRVVVRNQGDEAADIFKISIEYHKNTSTSSSVYTAPFRVPGESSSWYPYTDA
ncbi:MAG TPA: hypothetical protein HA261_12720, partial [Methanosarcina sp.]|nr:hypothetical protein [Methanosarcina sp.]